MLKIIEPPSCPGPPGPLYGPPNSFPGINLFSNSMPSYRFSILKPVRRTAPHAVADAERACYKRFPLHLFPKPLELHLARDHDVVHLVRPNRPRVLPGKSSEPERCRRALIST